jgi:hypothetical protein
MAHIVTRERKDGTRSYVVKWRDPDATFRETTFRTMVEARTHANAVEAAKRSGAYIDDRKGTLTFREVAGEWLPRVCGRRGPIRSTGGSWSRASTRASSTGRWRASR